MALYQRKSESLNFKSMKTDSSLIFTLQINTDEGLNHFLFTSSVPETQIWKTPDIPEPDDFSSHGEKKFHLVCPFLPRLNACFWNSFIKRGGCVWGTPLCFFSHDLAAHMTYGVHVRCKSQINTRINSMQLSSFSAY